MRTFTSLLGLFLSITPLAAQPFDLSFLATRPEASDFRETTSYLEVQAFLDVLETTSDRMHLTTLGYTMQGRPLPLAVFGDVSGPEPEAVRASGRTRVLLLATIHGGEVAGKEATLMLLRALAAGRHADWADSLVLLAVPVFNADGNEAVSLVNRPRQHGPVGGVGQRPNSQGLDLNRDHVKVDSPEVRSLLLALEAYDPHVLIDLHTTNGTAHAYHLTYAPPLHPSTDSTLVAWLRTAWLPEVSRAVEDRYGWATYYYGNTPEPGSDRPMGWYTFDHRPRFSTNYVGLRNRFGILVEAYAYAPFEERILATLYVLEELLAQARDHAGRLRAITEAADAQDLVGAQLALRARHARSAEPVEILLGEVVPEVNPYSGREMLRRTDARRPTMLYEYGTFTPTETAVVPAAYFVPPELKEVIARLHAHGVKTVPIPAARTQHVERFRIDSVQVAETAYQGRHLHTYYGGYETADVELPAGTRMVPMRQPLARLAFTLLEPRSDDGFAAWGLVGTAAGGAAFYPILRGDGL
ncbi:peptidase M14 [Rhodothermaceae bacterium RA]|nr:peptidase M14 [Rhodothermaceae bacterium RA]